MVSVIALCYLVEVFIVPIDWISAAMHTVMPQIADAHALLLAVGIIGATVMPHAVYLHSGLTQARMPVRDDSERRTLVRFSNREVIFALTIAGLVNMAMVMMASSAFHAGHPDVAEIETAYHTLTPLFGVGAAAVFLISLIASGISASTVGTMAGQMIMQGFVGFRIPIWLRRLVTMLPAFVVGHGSERDERPGRQSGRAEHRVAVADDRADHLHRPARHHGWIRQRPHDPNRRRGRRCVVIVLNLFLIAQLIGVPIPGSRLRVNQGAISSIGYGGYSPRSGFQIKPFTALTFSESRCHPDHAHKKRRDRVRSLAS